MSVGTVIASSDTAKAVQLRTLLRKYLPSEENTNIHIKNKYFECEVDVVVVNWEELSSLVKQEGTQIDCLMILIRNQSYQREKNTILSVLKEVVSKANLVSQVLIVDGEQSSISFEDLYDETDTFIESLNVDVEQQLGGDLQEVPQSISQDTEGIVRLVQILDSTSWRNLKKPLPKPAVQSLSVGPPVSQPKVYNEKEEEHRAQLQMNDFASLMEQMMAIKSQVLPDQVRKQRAADLITKLAMNFGEDDQDCD